jgi:hypothetical protein
MRKSVTYVVLITTLVVLQPSADPMACDCPGSALIKVFEPSHKSRRWDIPVTIDYDIENPPSSLEFMVEWAEFAADTWTEKTPNVTFNRSSGAANTVEFVTDPMHWPIDASTSATGAAIPYASSQPRSPIP